MQANLNSVEILSKNVKEKRVILSQEHIAEAACRLVAQAGHPAKFILFGSNAKGESVNTPDLALMVVEHDLTDRADEYLPLREAIGHAGAGVELFFVSAQEFERRSQVPGATACWATKEEYFMTPQRDEVRRFLRLAARDQAAFAAVLNAHAVDSVFAWSEKDISSHLDEC